MSLSITEKAAIASCVFSLLLLIVTAISVIYAFKAYHHQKDRSKKEAACKLARIYADEIIPQYQIIDGVFAGSELQNFIKEIFPMDHLSYFNLQELSELSLRAGIGLNDLTDKMESFDSLCILDIMTQATTSVYDRNALNAAYSKVDEKTGDRIPKNEKFLRIQFLDTISRLLNTLEWFSMNCRYGLADEKLLYQSLHQTFLSTVWMLYYFICKNNLKNENKYYTNTIWLFQQWKDRLSEQAQIAALEQQEALDSMQAARERYHNAGAHYDGEALK